MTLRPPNLRKVIADLSGRPDVEANVECENSHSLLTVVLHSNAIGICGAYSDALRNAAGALVRLTVDGLSDDCEELYTRYGIVSLARQRLAPLAEAMIEQIVLTDQSEEDVASLERLAV